MKKIMSFAIWVSQIDTSKYKKKQIPEIILRKYWKIFGRKEKNGYKTNVK
tara:strand:- start:184 stop:333 length:150 start_codon:yes stop_codon:yes gene_type:complete